MSKHHKKHHAHGGRVVDGHKPDHYDGIETPFTHHGAEDHPHHGSHPDHYAHHHDHVRKHHHGK